MKKSIEQRLDELENDVSNIIKEQYLEEKRVGEMKKVVNKIVKGLSNDR